MKRDNFLLTFLILIIVCTILLIPLYFTEAYYLEQEEEKKQIKNELQSTILIPHDIVFNLTDKLSKYTYSFVQNLTLNGLYGLEILFKTGGSLALSDTLKVKIVMEDRINISFTIDKLFQDSNIHSLTKSLYCENIGEETKITIYFEGQCFIGKEGNLTLFNTINLYSYDIPSLKTEETISPDVIPNSISFSGNSFSKKTFSVESFFNVENANITKVKLNFTFNTNDFVSLERKIAFQIGSNLIEKDFSSGLNTILLSLDCGSDLNILNISFTVGYSSDIIHLEDFSLSIEVEKEEETSKEREILEFKEWEGDKIDLTFDISILKSEQSSKELIINLNLSCGFEGATVTPYIEFRIISGIYTIYTGKVMSYEQSEEELIKINTYTYTYNKPLLVNFYAKLENSGKGQIFIYNSSNLTASKIPQMSSKGLFREVESEKNVYTPQLGAVILNYYDVFFNDYSLTIDYVFNLTFTLLTDYDEVFDRINVGITIGVNTSINKIFSKPGKISITEDVKIYQGYNEVKIKLTIYGSGTYVSLRNITYRLNPIEDFSFQDENQTISSVNIPLIKPPYTISLGISSILGQWVIGGVFARVFNSSKKKNKSPKDTKYKLEL
ncbi:MAG: hypothetical protein ACTSRR_03225 [Candidatus Heimdallarchaeaceae archaeon]